MKLNPFQPNLLSYLGRFKVEFKEYPHYKDSDIEWFGKVPTHWSITKFKYIFEQKKSIVNMSLPFGSISFGRVIYKNDKENLTDEIKINYQELLNGEYLINPLNLNYDLKSLRTALSEIDVVVSSGYIILLLKHHHINKNYIKYLLFIFDIKKMKNLGAGIRQTITFKDIGNCLFSLPSQKEQKKISNFLNKETKKIDTLIAKQKRLIELLEEQRKSIISYAVIKGLSPNVPMKDSGVEWLGEVPEHWEVKRFGYVFKENKKKNIGLKVANVLSLSYGYIKEKSIDDNKGLLPKSFETYQIIEPNDIIFRFTDLQNDKRSLRSAISKYHGIITSAYISVRTEGSSDFYNYLFRAYDLKKVFYSMGYGMRQSLKIGELNKLPIVVTDVLEQNKIVSFLDSETGRIDNLIAKQKKLIELLEEQRKSIISHVVTGKIDVRGFQI